MTELIISEKPKAAQKLANALADGTPEKKLVNKAPYYELQHNKKPIIVASVVGHVYGLKEKKGNKWTYPAFDIEWRPSSEVNKKSDFSKKYVTLLKRLAKKADTFTVATDYDIEGEVIGLNALRFACKQKDGNRMKFSTLMKEDLVKAYEHKSNTLDWSQAEAGLTRHELDWYYGINISRALTKAIKTTGMWKLLSSGRVQGPALAIVVEREKEIQAFKPEPYWQISLTGAVDKGILEAWHKEDKFTDKKKADEAVEKATEGPAVVEEVKRSEKKQLPPTPFDLTSLQTEAYRCLGIKPKETLSLAQDLYTDGNISYPRTSSQQLPPSIGFKKILGALTDQEEYEKIVPLLLKKKNLQPRNGKKTDPAHPAIYPTGQKPKRLGKRPAKLYDLIVRRFLATFGDAAIRETMKVTINSNNETFIAKGTRTKEPGWHVLYGPHVSFKEEELPDTKEGEELKNPKIERHDKFTKPPKRYTAASIIKELDKRDLGTKATRASIVETLYQRHYTINDPIEVTKLGMATVNTLTKFVPEILDEQLTTHFESEMSDIRSGKSHKEKVLSEAREALTKLLTKFKQKETDIGAGLKDAIIETRDEINYIGKCPHDDGKIMVRFGKFGRFAACNKYPDCKTTYKLPPNALVKSLDKPCDACQHPTVLVIKRGKRPQSLCLNIDCSAKQPSEEDLKLYNEEKGKTCPRCEKGVLAFRKGMYGSFLACDQHPKCRYVITVENGKLIKPAIRKSKKKKKGKKK